jgi:ABC-type Zn2+ transport system substrate-binding protein/surface adhesin
LIFENSFCAIVTTHPPIASQMAERQSFLSKDLPSLFGEPVYVVHHGQGFGYQNEHYVLSEEGKRTLSAFTK